MRYPPCPNCGHQLPIADFYREVGARRRLSFGLDRFFSSRQFRKDPYTREEVPVQFSITCARCGATSAVDTSPQDRVLLAIALGLVVLLALLALTRLATGWVILVFVTMYLGATMSIYRVASVFTSRMMTVRLTSMPEPERENQTPAARRARADHDMAVEIAGLGPNYQQVAEPEPLEPDLADVAARIDAAHAAAPPSTSGRPDYQLAEELELERAKVVCAKCGELNQRDFEECWNCESALPDAR